MSAKAMLLLGAVGIGVAMLVAGQNSKAAENPSPAAPKPNGGGALGFGPMHRGATYHIKITVDPTASPPGSNAQISDMMRADGWEGMANAFDPNGGIMTVATWNGADGATLPVASTSGQFLYQSIAAVA